MPAAAQVPNAAIGDGSVRYYLIIDGLDGGSTNEQFAHGFEISGFSLDLANPAPSGGGGTGKPQFGPLEIDFASGTAADEIEKMLVTGKHIKSVQLVGVTAGEEPQTVYDLRLADLLFSDFRQNAGGLDQLSIGYSKISLTTLDDKGMLETTGWDVAKAMELSDSISAPVPASEGSDGGFGPLNWYLTIDGLDGGSTTKGHEGAFGLSNFKFNSAIAGALTGGGSGTGKAVIDPLALSFDFGSAADEILSNVASGKRLKAVEIVGVAADGTHVACDLRLNDIVLGNATLVGGGMDQLKIDFNKFSLTTTNSDGASETMSFDRSNNTAGATQYTAAKASHENAASEGEPTYYLTIDGLDGGSTARGHKGAFEISGFDLGVANPGALTTGSGGGTGKAKFSPLDISFDPGSDLTRLMEYISTGKHLKSIRITGDEIVDGKPTSTGFDLRMADVTLASLLQGGKADAMSLAYSRYSLTTEGTDGSKETNGWDIAKNAAVKTPLAAPKAGDRNGTEGSHDLDYYLVIGGMDGGVNRAGHQGAFAVSNFDFDATVSAGAGGGGGGTGKTTFGNLEIDLKLGSAATDLAALVASGKHLKTIQLVGDAGTGKGAETVYDLRLGNATLASLLDGDAGQDHLSFAFKQYSLATLNDAGKRNVYGFDLAKNVSTGELAAPGKPGAHGTPGSDLQYYMAIDGLDGGSRLEKHAFDFVLDDVDFSLAQKGKLAAALSVHLDVGNASDELLELIATGKTIKNIEITGNHLTGDRSVTQYDLRLAGVTLTSLKQNEGDDDVIGLQFNSYTLTTKDDQGDAHTSGFNFKTGLQTDKPIAAAKPAADQGSAGQPDGYHLLIDGIVGGDRSENRLGAFDIDNFDFNIARPPATTGSGVGKATFAPIEISFHAGSAADELMLLPAKGQVIQTVQIVGDIDGEQPLRVFDLRLADVHVTKFQQGGDDDLITLTFSALSLTTLNHSDTGATREETYHYDIATQTGDHEPLPPVTPEI